MSQETLELVTRAVHAALARPPDFGTVNQLFAPDHVLVPLAAGVLMDKEEKGAQGFERWRQDVGDFLDAEHVAEAVVDLGPNKALAVVTTRYRGSASGVASEDRNWAVITVSAGKLVRTEIFSDPEDALRAALGPSSGD